VRWQREDLREIEYASVLHDFGKIGVREHVLVKAKKLFPQDLQLIQQRLEFVTGLFPELGKRLGRSGKESVRRRFLTPRLLRDWLVMFEQLGA